MGSGMSNRYRLQQEAAIQRQSGTVDLMKLLEAYVIDTFQMTHNTKCWKHVDLDNVNVKFNFDKMQITHNSPMYAADTNPLGGRGGENSSMLVEQMYDNKFHETIQHEFRAERNTKCTGRITITKAVTFPKGIDIPLPAHKNNPVGDKFPAMVTLLKSGDRDEISKTLEETLTWSMKTTIPIPAHKKVVARLSVVEEEHKQSFTMTSSIKGGPLRYTMTDPTDRKVLLSGYGWLGEILRGLRLPGVQINHSKQVDFTTEGTTYFRFGVRTVEDAEEVKEQRGGGEHQRAQHQQQQLQQHQQQQQQQHLQQQHHQQQQQEHQLQQQHQQPLYPSHLLPNQPYEQ